MKSQEQIIISGTLKNIKINIGYTLDNQRYI